MQHHRRCWAGSSTLIGLASLMLLALSGYATWHGMHDFIIGGSTARQDQALPGGIRLSNDAPVIAVVVALTFLMWLMLRETFAAKRGLRVRLVTFPLYLFLAIWSVGFGYSFWWSLIPGEEATRIGLAGHRAPVAVRSKMHGAACATPSARCASA
jgi:hypothetical protein